MNYFATDLLYMDQRSDSFHFSGEGWHKKGDRKWGRKIHVCSNSRL